MFIEAFNRRLTIDRHQVQPLISGRGAEIDHASKFIGVCIRQFIETVPSNSFMGDDIVIMYKADFDELFRKAQGSK